MDDTQLSNIQSVKLKYKKPEIIEIGTLKTKTLGDCSNGMSDKHSWQGPANKGSMGVCYS